MLNQNPLKDLPKALKIPDLTTATLEKHIPQIDLTWKIATQLATVEGEPYYRNYSVLSFPPSESTVNIIELGGYSEEYEGDFYYRVANNFYETSFSASVSPKGIKAEDFLRWRRVRRRFRQEIVYAHKLIETLTWDRPQLAQEVEDEDNPPPAVFLPIEPNPFILPLVESGQTIRAQVRVTPADSQVEVRLKASPSDPGILQTESMFLLTQPYIEVKLINVVNPPPGSYTQSNTTEGALLPGNGQDCSHHKVEIDFYGKFKWRTFAPAQTEGEKTLIHPVSASYATRLKPPGHQGLPDNFWNSNPDNLVMESFSNRRKKPAWA